MRGSPKWSRDAAGVALVGDTVYAFELSGLGTKVHVMSLEGEYVEQRRLRGPHVILDSRPGVGVLILRYHEVPEVILVAENSLRSLLLDGQ